MSIMALPNLPGRQAMETARQYSYRVLQYYILELLLMPGQKLNESDFAGLLHVSRTPIRDTFITLSNENLVDLIPNQGAFVSRIDSRCIKDAAWVHTQLGTSALHYIFINNITPTQLSGLHYNLHQQENYLAQNDFSHSARLIEGYYKELFLLGYHSDIIWSSLQKSDVDFRRLIRMSMCSTAIVEGFYYELTDLANALAKRDNDLACQIYARHIARIIALLPLLQQQNSIYFS